VGFDGLEIRHASYDDFSSVSSVMELFLSLTTICSCFRKWIRLVADVWIIGGSLPVLPGTAFSFEVVSVREVSVSMSVALRGAKNFKVTTSLKGIYKVGDVLFCTAVFFEAPAVSSMACRLCLRTSWKPSSSFVCCPVEFGELVWSARVFAWSTAFNSSTVTVYVSYRALKSVFSWRGLQ
jgi:hypothetical protein